MSQENVEVVRSSIETYDADTDAYLDFMAEDVEVRPDPSRFPEAEPLRGREEFRRFLADVDEGWEGGGRAAIMEIFPVGHRVVVRMDWGGRGRTSGIDLRSSLTAINTVQDGQIVKIEYFFDHAQALEAAGLSEEAMSQENVEVVRSIYEHWREGDFRSTADVFDQHVVLVLDRGFGAALLATGDVHYGMKALTAYTRAILEPMRRLTMEAEEITEAGDSILVAVLQRSVGSTSGVPTEARYSTIWTFRGRKVIRVESFLDRSKALEAAGLRE